MLGRQNANRKLLAGAIVGMLAGVSVMMFDQNVRSEMAKKSKRMKRFVRGIKEDPGGFFNNVKDGVNQISKSLKTLSSDLKQLLSQIEEIKTTSNKIIESAKDAEEEMKEIGSSLINVNGSSTFGDDKNRSKLH